MCITVENGDCLYIIWAKHLHKIKLGRYKVYLTKSNLIQLPPKLRYKINLKVIYLCMV